MQAGRPHITSQWDEMDAGARKIYLDNVDWYLSQRREKLALATSFWLSQGSHVKASFFAEYLLEDSFQVLNERLELLEKTPESALRQEVTAVLAQAPAARVSIPMFPDASYKALTERLYRRGDDTVAELYEQLQQGRAKAVPLWNYQTDRMPRLTHHLPNWTTEDGTGTVLINARKQLDKHKTAENLLTFQQAYRAYRIDMVKSLILSYRDPRLEEVHKLEWIDEVVQADQSGQLAGLKVHMIELAAAQGDPSERIQQIIEFN